jgi:hypothetical protein
MRLARGSSLLLPQHGPFRREVVRFDREVGTLALRDSLHRRAHRRDQVDTAMPVFAMSAPIKVKFHY